MKVASSLLLIFCLIFSWPATASDPINKLKDELKRNDVFEVEKALGDAYGLSQVEKAIHCYEKAANLAVSPAQYEQLAWAWENILIDRPYDPKTHISLAKAFYHSAPPRLWDAKVHCRRAIALSRGHRNPAAEQLLSTISALPDKQQSATTKSLNSAISKTWSSPRVSNFTVSRFRADINESGLVTEIHLICRSGCNNFDDSALKSLMSQSYSKVKGLSLPASFDFVFTKGVSDPARMEALPHVNDKNVVPKALLEIQDVRKQPESCSREVELGSLNMTLGRFDESRECLQRAIELAVTGADYYGLISSLEELLSHSPFDPQVHVALARAFYKCVNPNYSDAEFHCKRAMSLSPTNRNSQAEELLRLIKQRTADPSKLLRSSNQILSFKGELYKRWAPPKVPGFLLTRIRVAVDHTGLIKEITLQCRSGNDDFDRMALDCVLRAPYTTSNRGLFDYIFVRDGDSKTIDYVTHGSVIVL